ncbi:hypothetical protein MPSEU_000794200 [Mayamaea pseudoterrestris]|nr:hypothetical protein MPSEU_000794200 [Mayamaea pseudoterrestris]
MMATVESRLPSWIHFHIDDQQGPRDDASHRTNAQTRTPSTSPRRLRQQGVTPSSSPSAPTSPMSVMFTESVLVQLIRQGRHDDALSICTSDPSQARPVPIHPQILSSSPSSRWRSYDSSINDRRTRKVSIQLYHPTALGVALQQLFHSHSVQQTYLGPSTAEGETANATLIKLLIKACPWQLRCPQEVVGGTPLRQLLQYAHSDFVTLDLLSMLLQADEDLEGSQAHIACMNTEPENCNDVDADSNILSSASLWPAVNQRDSSGFDVLDYVVSSVHIGTLTIDKAMGILQLLMEFHSPMLATQDHDLAVLVRLFSLGTSFGYSPPSLGAPRMLANLSSPLQVDESGRLERMLEITHRLLLWRPSLLHAKSSVTGCTPLHVAIRNYGNFDRLIRELLLHQDDCQCIMQHRNVYGDLPLHVACAVGVPMDILHLILARTLLASEETASGDTNSSRGDGPHKLIWSRNLAGYTPVDLEWIRHIEVGNGFFSHRSFYPLDTRGIRKLPSNRANDMYQTLLRQAVDQIISNDGELANEINNINTNLGTSVAAHLAARVDWTSRENRSFGLLLHRIFLIIRTAFRDSFSTYPVDLSGDILHLATTLITPTVPSLPRPIGELILWQYPEELQRRDHLGRLPLHYCFGAAANASPAFAASLTRLDENQSTVASEWTEWVKSIIERDPLTCHVKDNFGRLPLHYALLQLCPSCADERWTQPVIIAMTNIIELLVDFHPDSVQICDPVTGLCPFMMAASNRSLPLSTTYSLLKHTPGVSLLRFKGGFRLSTRNRKRSLSGV